MARQIVPQEASSFCRQLVDREDAAVMGAMRLPPGTAVLVEMAVAADTRAPAAAGEVSEGYTLVSPMDPRETGVRVRPADRRSGVLEREGATVVMPEMMAESGAKRGAEVGVAARPEGSGVMAVLAGMRRSARDIPAAVGRAAGPDWHLVDHQVGQAGLHLAPPLVPARQEEEPHSAYTARSAAMVQRAGDSRDVPIVETEGRPRAASIGVFLIPSGAAGGARATELSARVLSGDVFVSSFVVQPGTVLVASDDLSIYAADEIVLRGQVMTRARDSARGGLDAPKLHFQAGRRIIVEADIETAAGAHASQAAITVRGGNGGDIVLDAPKIVFSQRLIRAGNGGAAGPGGKGGRGGTVLLIGNVSHPSGQGGGLIIGGNGGRAGIGLAGDTPLNSGLDGAPGGDGGDGGDALLLTRAQWKRFGGGVIDDDGPNGDPGAPGDPATGTAGTPGTAGNSGPTCSVGIRS